MNRSGRAAAVAVAFVAVVAGLAFTFAYLVSYPPTIAAAASNDVTLETVGAIGFGDHPTWVSYLAQENGKWVHSTVLQVPANSDIHFTIYQYDTGSQLRNPYMDQVAGTTDGTETLNGQQVRIVNDNTDNGIGHTFAIPSMGVFVPLPGVASTSTNFCNSAPCETNYDHNKIEFTIHTGAAGIYPWQCFVPCGLGFLIGNGGGMSTFGYMGGYLKVVA